MTSALETPIAAPAARPSAGRRARKTILFYVLVPLVALVLWSVLTYSGFVRATVLPTPTALVEHAIRLATDGYQGRPLLDHIWASLRRTTIGFVLAVLIGVPVGMAMGYVGWIRNLVSPVLSFLRPVPAIAFIPLAVLYLGIGEESKVTLIFYAAFTYVVINAQAGAAATQRLHLRAAQTLGLTRLQMVRYVYLPSALPSIMSGIRVAASVSWGVVVAAELIAAQSGIGFMISSAATFFDLRTVYIGIILIGLIGLLIDTAIQLASSRLLHWQGK